MLRFLFHNIVGLFFPRILKIYVLNLFGHSLHKTCKIGVVVLGPNVKLILDEGCQIGHFNYLNCNHFKMLHQARIGSCNFFIGFFSIVMKDYSSLGNFNKFRNGGETTIVNSSRFEIGYKSNITSYHYLDMTCDIVIGSQVVIGGRDSQFWTHGFQHFDNGIVRYRVDGAIFIGDGCYLGSRVVVNPSTKLANSISIGAGASIAGTIINPGLYVPTPLRYIDINKESFENRYVKLYTRGNPKPVYKKRS